MSANSRPIYFDGTLYPSMRSAAMGSGRDEKVVRRATARAIAIGKLRDGIPDVETPRLGVFRAVYVAAPGGQVLCNNFADAARLAGVSRSSIGRRVRAGETEFSIFGVSFKVAA